MTAGSRPLLRGATDSAMSNGGVDSTPASASASPRPSDAGRDGGAVRKDLRIVVEQSPLGEESKGSRKSNDSTPGSGRSKKSGSEKKNIAVLLEDMVGFTS